jgi:hypothetical protein
MSSSIWTQSAGSSRIRRLTSEPRRIVEAQHRVSTRKLVDSDREQAILEQLLDSSKPPLPADAGGLHYLLSTPFRYPPLAHGSRFGPRWERGIWYGSESLQTALAEVAYYRLVFLEGTEAPLAPLETELTAFTVPVMARRGIDLSSRAFERWGDALTSKTTYAGTQPLGRAMRAAGVEAFRFVSARDPGGGTNIGVFTAAAFGAPRPRKLQTWHSVATRAAVEFSKRDYFERLSYSFPRELFLVRGALPHPAIG